MWLHNKHSLHELKITKEGRYMWTWIVIYNGILQTLWYTLYSSNMSTSDLVLCPWAYISGKSQVPMLKLLCNTSKDDSLDVNTSVVTVPFIYACLEDSIMVRQQ